VLGDIMAIELTQDQETTLLAIIATEQQRPLLQEQLDAAQAEYNAIEVEYLAARDTIQQTANVGFNALAQQYQPQLTAKAAIIADLQAQLQPIPSVLPIVEG